MTVASSNCTEQYLQDFIVFRTNKQIDDVHVSSECSIVSHASLTTTTTTTTTLLSLSLYPKDANKANNA